MCRLLGYFDPAQGSPEDWFLRADRSLLAQSDHIPDQLQDDGWGTAWYADDGRGVVVRKGVRGAFRPEERTAFAEAARSARGPVVVGHLRHASNPLQLAKEKLWALENSQPFTHVGSIFAHNGAIYQPTEVRSRLGRYASFVRGINDSEVLFWLLTRREEELGDPIAAYARAVADLWEVWEASGRPPNGPYGGLNILWTRGRNELWAFCHWRGEHGSGLFATDCAYYEMSYRRAGSTVVVGSEPFDTRTATWQRIPNGTYLRLEATGGHTTVSSGSIPLELGQLKV